MQKLNSKKAYSEIYEILNILGKDFINKIPTKLYHLIDEERDKNYVPNLLLENGMLDETKISQETIALFAVLNLKYFVESEQEKKEFLNILNANEQKYQEELHEKYNPDNIFQNQEPIENEVQENIQLIEYKESLFRKILNKIKNIFKKK